MNHQTWDEWMLKMCETVATNSKCLSRKIGTVLVRDKSIISQGYNGPPRGVRPCNERVLVDDLLAQEYRKVKSLSPEKVQSMCPRYVLGFKSGEGLDLCVAGHAERNSLINAARNGIETRGTTLYMSCGVPCTPCLVEIINAGVECIVVTKESYYDRSAHYLLKESGLNIRLFHHDTHMLYPNMKISQFKGVK